MARALEAGVKMSLANPILGVGLDQFGINDLNPAYRTPQATANLDHAHSFFPEIAAELGLIAVVLALVIYAALLWAMMRIYLSAREPLTRALAAGLLASIVAWLVSSTADGFDFYRDYRLLSSNTVFMCVVLASAVALARMVQSEKQSRFSMPPRRLSI